MTKYFQDCLPYALTYLFIYLSTRFVYKTKDRWIGYFIFLSVKYHPTICTYPLHIFTYRTRYLFQRQTIYLQKNSDPFYFLISHPYHSRFFFFNLGITFIYKHYPLLQKRIITASFPSLPPITKTTHHLTPHTSLTSSETTLNIILSSGFPTHPHSPT